MLSKSLQESSKFGCDLPSELASLSFRSNQYDRLPLITIPRIAKPAQRQLGSRPLVDLSKIESGPSNLLPALSSDPNGTHPPTACTVFRQPAAHGFRRLPVLSRWTRLFGRRFPSAGHSANRHCFHAGVARV
eukprot:Gb_24813 [translate_table: standard]